MTWEAARIALDTQFLTLSGLNTARVAWPGVPFTQPTTGIWYKISFIPASVAPEMGGADHEGGVYQVSVFAASGSGIGALARAADAVVALFSRRRLTNVSCGVPTLGPVLEEVDWLHLPVSVPFQNL